MTALIFLLVFTSSVSYILNYGIAFLLQGAVYFLLAVSAFLNGVLFIVIRRRCFLYLTITFTMSVGTYLGFYRTRIRKKFNIRVSITLFMRSVMLVGLVLQFPIDVVPFFFIISFFFFVISFYVLIFMGKLMQDFPFSCIILTDVAIKYIYSHLILNGFSGQ